MNKKLWDQIDKNLVLGYCSGIAGGFSACIFMIQCKVLRGSDMSFQAYACAFVSMIPLFIYHYNKQKEQDSSSN
jgi:hypothetical protein